MTTINVFETIINNPEKISYYKKDPILEATFMALYNYKKNGNNFSDLPWFKLSKLK